MNADGERYLISTVEQLMKDVMTLMARVTALEDKAMTTWVIQSGAANVTPEIMPARDHVDDAGEMVDDRLRVDGSLIGRVVMRGIVDYIDSTGEAFGYDSEMYALIIERYSRYGGMPFDAWYDAQLARQRAENGGA